MSEQKTIFVTPEPTLERINVENEKLSELIMADDGGKLQHEGVIVQTAVVVRMLKELIFYVNKVAQGDKFTILASGFDINNEPTRISSVPGKPIIRKAIDGSAPCSVKILIDTLPSADRFKLEICNSLINPVWIEYTDHANTNSLEAKDQERGKEIFVRVTGGNSFGWGEPSEPISFIPR